jgi:hypothetical protein
MTVSPKFMSSYSLVELSDKMSSGKDRYVAFLIALKGVSVSFLRAIVHNECSPPARGPCTRNAKPMKQDFKPKK